MTVLSTDPYKGARDWYPEQMRIREYIFNTWRRVVRSYGYEAYDAPLLEPVNVYEAKSGQELVDEQTYRFTDRGGYKVTIRPEMTPSTSRMIAARIQEIAMPARWYSIAQFMRYEKPQRDCEREFWQLNCDVFGCDGAIAEAEIINIGADILKALGATNDMFIIRINNRRIINFMMAQYLGLDTVQAQLMIRLFDRKKKIMPEEFRDQAIEVFGDSMAREGLQKLAHLLAAKTVADLPEVIRNSDAVKEVQELFTQLERAGIKNAIFDITLMRGLDYYTGTIFEFFDTHPENTRSLLGGGRYDGLVGLFVGESVSAVGLAVGLTMTELFVESHKLLPKFTSTTDLYMIVIGDSLKGAQKLAQDFRKEGINVEVDFTGRKLDRQLKNAIKKTIPYLMVIGKEELNKEIYTLKNTATSEEIKQSFERVVSYIKDRRRMHSPDDEDFDLEEVA